MKCKSSWKYCYFCADDNEWKYWICLFEPGWHIKKKSTLFQLMWNSRLFKVRCYIFMWQGGESLCNRFHYISLWLLLKGASVGQLVLLVLISIWEGHVFLLRWVWSKRTLILTTLLRYAGMNDFSFGLGLKAIWKSKARLNATCINFHWLWVNVTTVLPIVFIFSYVL